MKSILFIPIFLIACDDHIFEMGGSETTESGSAAFEAVFANNCASCHGGGLAPNLAENICDNIVGVPSTQVPTMNFITPNEPENSYLLHKLKGTGAEVGGTASIMPTTGALADSDIQIIEDWINAGAVCGSTATEDTGSTAEDTATDTGATAVDLTNGEDIVTTKCNVCHVQSYAPEFATTIPSKTDGEIIDIVQNGGTTMLPQDVTDYDLIDMLAYLRATYPAE